MACLAALGGCKRWEKKMEDGRQALLSQATPCPAPATCTEKGKAGSREVSLCSALPAARLYSVGDVVIVREVVGDIHTLARVTKINAGKYTVDFAENMATNEIPEARMVGRLCP
jgi:hypothetical protein